MLAQVTESYLREVLQQEVTVCRWSGESRLASYLLARYSFHELFWGGNSALLLVDQAQEPLTPSEIAKQIEQVELQEKRTCIYAAVRISSFNRQRLIAKGVQFIVPGNQMFLPRFGMDLRERFIPDRQLKRDQLSPSAQAALIHYLLNPVETGLNATIWAPRLTYTRMTMGRVFDELLENELVTMEVHGRERWCHFLAKGRQLWEKALPSLRTPVRRDFLAPRGSSEPMGLRAGLSALSESTMLAESRTESRAVSSVAAKRLEARWKDGTAYDTGPDLIRYEVWTYPPEITVGTGAARVDPFSLYLSLQKSTDERVEMAREGLLETYPW